MLGRVCFKTGLYQGTDLEVAEKRIVDEDMYQGTSLLVP